MNFKVGDRVRMTSTGIVKWGDQAESSEGTIKGLVSVQGWFRVEWDNGHRNSYETEDLVTTGALYQDSYDPEAVCSHVKESVCHCQSLLAGHDQSCAYYTEQRGAGLWGIKRVESKTRAEINEEHATKHDLPGFGWGGKRYAFPKVQHK